MTLELHATAEEVMRAVEAFQSAGRARRIPERTLFGLMLALEECGSNIVNHALRRDASRIFRVFFEISADTATLELRDRGPAFDPTVAPVAAPAANDDLPPGGWGIQLVRRYTDEIRYARRNDENILCLVKRFTPATDGQNALPEGAKQPTLSPQTDMPLQIQIQKNVGGPAADAVTVKLNGSLDTATAPELERQLAPVLAGPVRDLVFDLAQLKFISSAGLRVFSTARKQLKERGGQASFIHMQPQIQEVFEIMRSLPGVAVFKDMAELDRYLAVRQRAHTENQ
jgi:anti-sigma B factor antagonist